MQRVINYYYNFTKSTTMGETKSRDLLSLNEVVNQALRYSKTDRELEIEKEKKPVHRAFFYPNNKSTNNGSGFPLPFQ